MGKKDATGRPDSQQTGQTGLETPCEQHPTGHDRQRRLAGAVHCHQSEGVDRRFQGAGQGEDTVEFLVLFLFDERQYFDNLPLGKLGEFSHGNAYRLRTLVK